jgi:hypothetical protein
MEPGSGRDKELKTVFQPYPGPDRTRLVGRGFQLGPAKTLRDLNRALAGAKKGTCGFPTWRKAGKSRGLCVRDVTVCQLNRKWAALTVPECGPVRCRLSRPLPEHYGQARVTLDSAGWWHVSFSAPPSPRFCANQPAGSPGSTGGSAPPWPPRTTKCSAHPSCTSGKRGV